MQAVRSDIRKGKALAWLVEHVEIVDGDGKTIDRADLALPEIDLEAESQDEEATEAEAPADEEQQPEEQLQS